MNEHFTSTLQQCTGATSIQKQQVIQKLWSGYGQIIRLWLSDSPFKSVVAKHIQCKASANHPRGWNTDIGHQRKLRSYEVETHWYQSYGHQSRARLPKCLAVEYHQEEVLILLEDLHPAGFPLRKQFLHWPEIEACLAWLAQFHASYLGQNPEGLWEIGTYWHLATRPQELQKMEDLRLKEAAPLIDQKLNECTYKTYVHGDAKLANFCFGMDGSVAAVDFQYVGGGCGMKDLAYFIGSCLSEEECEQLENKILDSYFEHLQSALDRPNDQLEEEWRSLYYFAWADFHRFLKGWSPGHWKINSYSERITRKVIEDL